MSIEVPRSNYNKLTKARDTYVKIIGLIASANLDYEHVSGLIDGTQGLLQDLTDLVEKITPIDTGRGRKAANDIEEALEDDPRTPEEIAADEAVGVCL